MAVPAKKNAAFPEVNRKGRKLHEIVPIDTIFRLKIAEKKDCLNNPLPITRRSVAVIVRQAVLLTPDHRLSRAFPKHRLQWRICEIAPRYSGGTVLALHQTSLLSPKGHLSQIFN